MVKTQVQIPDHLYREAKRLARENEMSFAEVVRRGLEEIVRHHPPGRTRPAEWAMPAPVGMGEALLPEEDWTAASHE